MRKSGESKSALIKRIVDIDVELSVRKDLTTERRRALEKMRANIERRIYR